MKILLVNYRYFISGGPEKYMFNIKTLLEEKGHEVFPFSIHSSKNVETEYSRYFVEPIGDRNAVYFDEVKKNPRSIWQMLTRSIYSLEVKKAIKKEIEDLHPDLVYIIHFVNKLSPSVIIGAKEMGIPVVLRLSDYFMLCPRFDFLYNKTICEECLSKGYISCIKKKCVKGSFFASLVRVISMKIHKYLRIYDNVDAFITPSEFLKNKLIENGYDETRITCIPTFSISNNPVSDVIGDYGLYFGRISEEKGVETIIHAFEKLPSKKMIIVGDDTTDEAIRLKEYVYKKNLANIKFAGFMSGIGLDTIIAGSRYTIIPSIWYDNLPNTALESFFHSKPVIASNIGSLPELVVDGFNGYLFEPGDPEDLKKKIELIDYNETIQVMGKNSKTLLEKHFSPQTHYMALLKVFDRVMAKEKQNM